MTTSKDLATFIAKHNINYNVVGDEVNFNIDKLRTSIWPRIKDDGFNTKMKNSIVHDNVEYVSLDELNNILNKEKSVLAKSFRNSLQAFTQDVFFELLNAPATPDVIEEDGDTYVINGIKLVRIEKFKDKWSRGKVVAKILGYEDTKSLITSLDDKYKCYHYYLKDDIRNDGDCSDDESSQKFLGELSHPRTQNELTDNSSQPIFNPRDIKDKKFEPHDKAIYLNNEGVLHLINVSQKQVAKEIRDDMMKIYGKIVLAGECSVNGETLKPKKTAFTTPLTRGRKATPKATKVGDTSLSPRIRSKSRDNLMKNISTIKAGLYFLEINYENEQGDTLYKCGHTKDITTRLNDHETNFGNYTVLHFEPVMASHIAEDAMFDMLKRLGMLQPTQDVDGLSKRELIILGEHTKDDVIEIMGKAAKSTIIDKDILLSMEETTCVKIKEESRLSHEEIKLKLKQEDSYQEELKLKSKEEDTKQLSIKLELTKLNKII